MYGAINNEEEHFQAQAQSNNGVSAFSYEEEKKEPETELRINKGDSEDISQPIMQLMQIHQQMSGQRFSNMSEPESANLDEFSQQYNGYKHHGDEFRGRQPSKQMHIQQPIYKKNMSSPSKMFKQFNPTQASRSPYRQVVDNSESTSIGPQTQSSYKHPEA
jgi:hypothetical protein